MQEWSLAWLVLMLRRSEPLRSHDPSSACRYAHRAMVAATQRQNRRGESSFGARTLLLQISKTNVPSSSLPSAKSPARCCAAKVLWSLQQYYIVVRPRRVFGPVSEAASGMMSRSWHCSASLGSSMRMTTGTILMQVALVVEWEGMQDGEEVDLVTQPLGIYVATWLPPAAFVCSVLHYFRPAFNTRVRMQDCEPNACRPPPARTRRPEHDVRNTTVVICMIRAPLRSSRVT